MDINIDSFDKPVIDQDNNDHMFDCMMVMINQCYHTEFHQQSMNLIMLK
jgi:hypothetical protein